MDLDLYCITNKRVSFLEDFSYNLAWVGGEAAPKNYLTCDKNDNIFHKEKYYSELTFQYWYWKNLLNRENSKWIGFCQKRRFWLQKNISKKKNEKVFKEELLTIVPSEWNNYDSIICKPINVNKIKKIKMLKRGYKSLIKNPLPFFQSEKRTIKFHFDMHHGHGNLDKAINVMNEKDKFEFKKFVETETSFNPHIMFISKTDIMDKWFSDLFAWLFECEKVFGFSTLKGYDTTRLYAYLAERYLSFWFNKYTKKLEWEWTLFE